jgi:hypothetical protein
MATFGNGSASGGGSKLGAIAALFVSAIPLSVAILFALGSARALLWDSTTTGTVVELKLPPSKGQHYLEIEYAAGGKFWRLQSRQHYNPAEHTVGSTVPVLYRPGDPRIARIAIFEELWGLPLFAGFFGTMFFALGLIVLTEEYRKNHAERATLQMSVVWMFASNSQPSDSGPRRRDTREAN